MTDFLTICQEVAQETDVPGVAPTTVVGQTGDLLKLVNRTIRAWERIQLSRNNWKFMRVDFPSTALSIVNQVRYTAASFGITNLAEWVNDPRRPVTMYVSATGVSDEGKINFLEWDAFEQMYLRGTQTANRPIHWSISDDNEFCLGPKPEAVYRLNGIYRRTPQILALDADEPICPAEYHRVIVWDAVRMIFGADEAPADAKGDAAANYFMLMQAMEQTQLPRMAFRTRPLA